MNYNSQQFVEAIYGHIESLRTRLRYMYDQTDDKMLCIVCGESIFHLENLCVSGSDITHVKCVRKFVRDGQEA